VTLRTVIMPAGILLLVTLPLWENIPGVSYAVELLTAALVIAAAVELRATIMSTAAIVGLIIGIALSSTLLPLPVFLPIWGRAFLPPLALGTLVAQGRSATKSFTAAAIISGLAMVVLYIPAVDLINGQLETVQKQIGQIMNDSLTKNGYAVEVINEFMDKLAYTTYLVKRLMPGILVMSAVVQLLIAFLMVQWYYSRGDNFFPGFGPYIYWKMPEAGLYLVGLTVIVRLTTSGIWQVIADNFFFILALWYGVCGLSIMEHVLRRLRLPLFIKIIFYLGLVLMQIPGLIFAAAAGLFDSYFDFRKVKAHTLG
jgi:hypothetical protein